MTNTSKTVVFFGNERLATAVTTAAPTLQALIKAGYHIPAVISHNEVANSRKPRTLEIAEVATAHKIPILLPEKPVDILEQLKEYRADIGVLVAYGKIIPESIINSFPHGIVNIHPSLLPLHRGSIPIESVILEGAKKTGVSLMQLVKTMDAGPVYAQEKFTMPLGIDKQQLADQLLVQGSSLVIEHLPAILDRSLEPTPQDDSLASYDNLIQKEDGVIDWTKPAEMLEREVRAYLNWPKSRATIAGAEVIITKSHVKNGSGKPGSVWREANQFGFYTTKDILVIDTLKPASKSEMPASAYLAGYKLG